MAGKDCMSSELDAILAPRAARRLVLARLPIEEKVKILIEFQKMTAPNLLMTSSSRYLPDPKITGSRPFSAWADVPVWPRA